MRKPNQQKLNITVVFCENEEENEIAFENAVKIIMSIGDKEPSLTK